MFFAMDAGQLSLLESLTLFVALVAQGRNRPAVSGAALALATIKTATLVPFLVLFLRRSDRRVWLFLTIFVIGLLLATCHPTDLPEWLSTMISSTPRIAGTG